jgi:hypothetical protein
LADRSGAGVRTGGHHRGAGDCQSHRERKPRRPPGCLAAQDRACRARLGSVASHSAARLWPGAVRRPRRVVQASTAAASRRTTPAETSGRSIQPAVLPPPVFGGPLGITVAVLDGVGVGVGLEVGLGVDVGLAVGLAVIDADTLALGDCPSPPPPPPPLARQ